MNLSLAFVTITVMNLDEAKAFYQDILEFKPTLFYEPTTWLAFDTNDSTGGFAIMEVKNRDYVSESTVDFYISDLDQYYNKIKNKVNLESPPRMTPWGSYKFVIRDLDGNRLGFVQKRE